MSSLLSQQQILQGSYDEVNQALQVEGIGGALITKPFDAIVATYPTSSVEVYTYHDGGVTGPVVGIITVTYSDSTKATLLTVVRT